MSHYKNFQDYPSINYVPSFEKTMEFIQYALKNSSSELSPASVLELIRSSTHPSSIEVKRNSDITAAERFLEFFDGTMDNYPLPAVIYAFGQNSVKQVRELIGLDHLNGSPAEYSFYTAAWAIFGNHFRKKDQNEFSLEDFVDRYFSDQSYKAAIDQLFSDRLLYICRLIESPLYWDKCSYIYHDVGAYTSIAQEQYYHRDRIDPLILDLNGNGKIDVTGTEGGAHFDYNGDGVASLSGWVGAGDGMLVYDRNGDGVINNGSELFGDDFILGVKEGYEGTEHNPLISNREKYQYAQNGFEALASLDSNGDGIINQQDVDYHQIKVWVDKNGDDQGSADGSSAEFSR